MSKMTSLKIKNREAGRASHRAASKRGNVRVTFAGGRVETHPDDGRSYPEGTMIQWDDRWTVVGCAWPFDD